MRASEALHRCARRAAELAVAVAGGAF